MYLDNGNKFFFLTTGIVRKSRIKKLRLIKEKFNKERRKEEEKF